VSDRPRGLFMDTGFKESSEFELGDKKVPYFGIKLTPEQAKLVEHTELDFLRIDGRTMFEVRDENGVKSGYLIFVIFK
jgi:hypothetical protein